MANNNATGNGGSSFYEEMAKLYRQRANDPKTADKPLTADEITEIIKKLVDERNATRAREENERKEKDASLARERQQKSRREAEEALRKKEEAARKEKEAKEREDARIAEITSAELPLDWENAFIGDARAEGVHSESISDGLILSLTALGKVDIEYISSITGEDCKTVIMALKGSIYQNPDTWEECFYKGWETAEEYLSGNIMRKYKSAVEANEKYNGYFEENLEALKRELPPAVSAKEIFVTLGSPWVPVDIIDEFVCHIMKFHKGRYNGTKHDEITGTWSLEDKGSFVWYNTVAARSTYGTPKLDALHIIERTLNMKTVAVTEEEDIPRHLRIGKQKTRRVVNKNETLIAIEKQKKLVEEFQKWIWKDKDRRERLEEIFENKFGCVRRRIFDGSFLKFPTMSENVYLYPYQKNAVARILFSPNVLLAHDVGSGKTFVMVAAGMELRRMGLSTKNLYVVPNNIVGQWRDIFLSMYPDAKLLVVDPKSFTPEKKNSTLRKIRDEDYDGIIMAYSCFERILLSRKYQMKVLEEKKREMEEALKDKKKTTSRLKKREEAISKAIGELAVAVDGLLDNEVYFDELGISRLFVDEAHNYKNLPLETKVDKVLGISPGGSKKCQDMLDKVRCVQKANGGGGVVMATGTPITNSITDAFVMQSYLQSGELAMLDLQSFDSWLGLFAERVTEFEVDVDTSGYRLATRFAKFHNLPELTALLSSIADFHQVDKSAGIPDFDGYTQAIVGKTKGLSDYLSKISTRADTVRAGRISRAEDNMLKITTDGRKAALDLRLVDEKSPFTFQSKVARCAENVYDIYCKTMVNESAQLVFCDSSTPKPEFNIYDELKRLLIAMGMPPEKIAFVHDADSESQRSKLFAKVRCGEIRVLVGSTNKLGLGVNVQDKLIAIHHIDAPWRPADLTQRDGRILRQGNTNARVFIYRYVTEGSFDSYVWQLLETKARFIAALLSGSLTQRSASDIEDTVLDYAEVKALAIGNPLIKERVEVANELNRCLALQKKVVEEHLRLEKELAAVPWQIKRQNDVIAKCEEDLKAYEECKIKLNPEERRELRESIHEAVKANVLMQEETLYGEYQGFSIILPLNMTGEKPFVWLVRSGKYYVELGDSAVGTLVRIDNYLDSLCDHLNKLREELGLLLQKENSIRIELSKKEDYTDKIENLKKRLEKIDKKLGVSA